jgi:hypothetical protein
VASLATVIGIHCAVPEEEEAYDSDTSIDSGRPGSEDQGARVTASEASQANAVDPAGPRAILASAEEPVGEAASAYTTRQIACIYACGAAAAAGCAVISQMCVAGTVVTIGGVAIPCLVAIAAACGAAGGAGAVCGAYCAQ